MIRTRDLTVVVAIGLLVTACGGDDGALQAGEDYSVADALGELPADLGADVYISTADLDAVCEANGCERPDGVDDEEGAQTWAREMAGATDDPGTLVYAPIPWALLARSSSFGEFQDQLGWSLVDVDSYISFEMPPEAFTVVSGDATLSDDLIDLDDGIVTTSEANDLAPNPSEISPADEMGRPVRLAEDDSRIAMSVTTPPVEAWTGGPDEALASDEGLNAVATALDDADVVSAVIQRGDPGGTVNGEGIEAVLAPFESVGIGWSADDDEATATVVYQHASTDAADANADAIQSMFDESAPTATGQPVSDLFTLEGASTDDSVLTVMLQFTDGAHPQNVLDMLQNQDVLFAHS